MYKILFKILMYVLLLVVSGYAFEYLISKSNNLEPVFIFGSTGFLLIALSISFYELIVKGVIKYSASEIKPKKQTKKNNKNK